MKKPGRYSNEFKHEAIRLLNEANKPISEIAMELGVKRTLLYRWRDQLDQRGNEAFQGPGRPTVDKTSEISKLKRELQEVKEERDILKKRRRTLPGTSSKVRVYKRLAQRAWGPNTMPNASCEYEWLLCVEHKNSQSSRKTQCTVVARNPAHT